MSYEIINTTKDINPIMTSKKVIMAVNNYDNLIAGRYSVSVFPYSENKILLFDENGDCIPLVNGLDSVKCKVRK